MKKFYLLLTLIVITTIQVANAQAPQGIPYQAVARNNAGNLIKNQPISLRFSIHDGSASGAVVYSETHAVTTDALGLFSVNIGGGTSSGTLADVNWGSGAKFTQVELDVTGGTNFADMGTTQMMSVPYALYAGSSAAAPSVFQTTAADPNNISNVNSGNVGIGTDAPTEKLDVVGNAKVSGKLSANGGIANGTNSTALGYGTIANGYASTATGIYTKTYSEATTAMGGETIASASCATAMGLKSIAYGVASTAMGFSTTAGGYFTTAMGNRTTSKSFAETSIGTNNTDYTPNSTYSYDAADRLFVIGNGADENNKSDAMIVLKNGNTTINGDVTANSIKIPNGTNTEFLMADGTTSVGPDLTGYATTDALNNIAYVLNSNLDAEIARAQTAEYGLSTQLDDEVVRATTAEVDLSNQISNIQSNFVTTSSDPNNISNVNSGNVGIGTDLPSEKLDVNGNVKVRGTIIAGEYSSATGINSFSMGSSTIASGDYSTAMGYGTVASGGEATVFGVSSTASGLHSLATGYGTQASGTQSTTMGGGTLASGVRSTAMGFSSNASGDASVAMGTGTTARSVSEIAVGMYNTDYQPSSTEGYVASDRLFVIGNGTDANNKSDAMVVLKNGNTTINGDVTANSIKIPNGTNTEFLMADGTTSAGTVATTMGSIGDSPSANGGTITSGVLNLTPADANNAGIVTTGDQTFEGVKTFSKDAKINGITVGAGGGGTSQYNVAIGYTALLNNTTGYGNTALGASALRLNIGGVENTAVGNGALPINTSGYRNTVIGSSAQRENTNGYENTATGFNAIMLNTSGNNNTANGSYSLLTNTTGSNNSAFGDRADVATGDLSNATAIGSGAIVNASNKIQLGNTNVTAVNTSGTYTGAGFVKDGGTSSQYLMADGSVTTGQVYTIGLWPELGGYVFRISADGKHGLVAETVDQSVSSSWYSAEDVISNPTKHSSAGAKFMDWRLPTKYEFMEIYTQRLDIGGFTITYYWSSIQNATDTAWEQNFNNGLQYSASKSFGVGVRSVRAF